MADKSPQDYQTWKDENLCVSILGLLHKSRNLVSLFPALKNLLYTFPCTVDRGGTSILSPGNVSPKEKVHDKQ